MKPNYRKNKANYKKYLFQCSLATIVTFLILLFIDKISSLIIIASFGASTFIVFTKPSARGAKARNLIGGYLIGTIVGLAFYYINWLISSKLQLAGSHIFLVLSSALSIGFTSLLLVITDTEHPPAVGMALALLINDWSYISIAITLLAVVSLTAAKELLKPYLVNLN